MDQVLPSYLLAVFLALMRLLWDQYIDSCLLPQWHKSYSHLALNLGSRVYLIGLNQHLSRLFSFGYQKEGKYSSAWLPEDGH